MNFSSPTQSKPVDNLNTNRLQAQGNAAPLTNQVAQAAKQILTNNSKKIAFQGAASHTKKPAVSINLEKNTTLLVPNFKYLAKSLQTPQATLKEQLFQTKQEREYAKIMVQIEALEKQVAQIQGVMTDNNEI